MSDQDPPDVLSRLCAELPLPDVLDALERHLPSEVTIEVFLWDYQRRNATGIRSDRAVGRGDLAGVMADAEATRTLEVHGEAVGVLVVEGAAGCVTPELADRLAHLLAVSIRASESISDIVAVRRRTRSLSLPAEMQWRVLPPSRFAGDGVSISAAVEPAYDTAGDVFDYALTETGLFLAVLDARGHGLQAATTATLVTSAMRRSRRNGDGLLQIAEEMHNSVGALGDEDDFVSAVLLEVDLETWTGRWLSAGHLPPLIVGDEVVPLPVHPTLPLGMVVRGEVSRPVVQDFTLAPGHALVLYSDGVIENAAEDDGQALGEHRFHRALLDRVGTDGGGIGNVARAVVEDLLAITGPALRDDATLLVVERPSG